MKTPSFYGMAAWLVFSAGSPYVQVQTAAQQHESIVVNIEVPVRVFKKDAFIEGLTLADFEVYENGVRQPVEAVYLVRDRNIVREDKASSAAPRPIQSRRHFVLSLDLKESLPKINDALDYFFANVLAPGDSLSVITPVQSYRFKPDALNRMKPQQISDSLKSRLKKDIQAGSTAYRTMMRDFYRLEKEEYPPDMQELKEMRLFDQAMQMRDLNALSEKRVMAFAEDLKSRNGEKHVFLIFQKDILPDHAFSWEHQNELLKTVSFDTEKIKRTYSDASITIHFLYITKAPAFAVKSDNIGRPSLSFQLPDLSSDIYLAFKDMAQATGGLAESTNNPDFGLRQAAEASSHYYLLCYRPSNYQADGTFKSIEVRIKGGGYRVTHRLGYVAD